MQQALDASTEGFQWITDAFILPTAALLLTCGMVGDLYGRKKTYLAGLALFCLGCVVCLTAGSVVHAPRRRHRRRRRTPPGPRADVLTYSGERPATGRWPAALHRSTAFNARAVRACRSPGSRSPTRCRTRRPP
ncbi:MFS transporter [Streptomyces sp. NPDC001714]|uniref:MFS transporter n=1 Tax=Streptomyces sp. NPDC001714 TaxID=3364603 RepID=UPI00368292F3